MWMSPRAGILEPGINFKTLIDRAAKNLCDSKLDNSDFRQK